MSLPIPIQQAWLRLSLFPHFGPARLMRIFKTLPEVQALFSSDARTLLERARIEPDLIEQFMSIQGDSVWEARWQTTGQEQIQMTLFGESSYPKMLSAIHHPPVVLFHRGSLEQPWKQMIAVVGTRTLSSYGRSVTPALVGQVAQRGIGIVSGLAVGIDALSHIAALEGQSPTVGVVAGGVDRASLFPSIHLTLADRIVEGGGCVMSEFPPGTMPLKHYFPMRNRIIAGLTRATLVIEADTHSGALITARCALEENREVYAVPGPITAPTSSGTNALIRLGAGCVTSADDLLSDLEFSTVRTSIAPLTTALRTSDNPHEQSILDHLSQEPVDVDTIIRTSGLPATDALSALSMMELKGWIRSVGPSQYIRS